MNEELLASEIVPSEASYHLQVIFVPLYTLYVRGVVRIWFIEFGNTEKCQEPCSLIPGNTMTTRTRVRT